MAARVRVLHAVSLDTPAGTEYSFHGLLVNGDKNGIEHHVLIAREPCHAVFLQGIRENAKSVCYAKYWNGLKIPKHPAFLRRCQADRVLKDVRPDVTILYNCLGNLTLAAAAGDYGGVCVYWERGAAWMSHSQENVTQFLNRMDVVLCNSHAGKRILELRWGADSRKIIVHHNPLRYDLQTQNAEPQCSDTRGPLRLGVVGRLVSSKGFPLALHAIQRLIKRGLRCELHVAGAGPNEAALRNLAECLKIQGCIRFRGHERNIVDAYRKMDLMLCPSIREPFGNVCVEAAHFGIPVVGAFVDGIPETVAHQKTGLCLPTTLPLEQYEDLGGTTEGLPLWTYDPQCDSLAEPRILDPDSIASAVMTLVDDPELVRQMRIAAREFVDIHRRFDDYLLWFNSTLEQLTGRHMMASVTGKAIDPA